MFAEVGASTAETASLTWVHCWWPNAPQFTGVQMVVIPLPSLILDPGCVITSSTEAIDTGDQWSAITLRVIEETVKWGERDVSDDELVIIEGVNPQLMT